MKRAPAACLEGCGGVTGPFPHLHLQAPERQTGGDGHRDCVQKASALMSFLLEPGQVSGSTPPRGASPVLIFAKKGLVLMKLGCLNYS